jgi:hypothetical protein
MKRTEAGEVLTRLAQLDRFANEFDDIDPLFDLINLGHLVPMARRSSLCASVHKLIAGSRPDKNGARFYTRSDRESLSAGI